MWKVFLVISAVVLGGAGYFAYQNKAKVTEVRSERARNDELLVKLEEDLEEEQTKLSETEAATRSLQDEAEQTQTKIAQAEAKSSELELQASTLKQNLENAEAKLDTDKKFLQEVPDIEARQREILESEQEVARLEATVSGLQNQVAQVAVQKEQLQQAAEGLRKLKEDQDAGRIRGEFTSTIKKAYNQWGFVVIDGGNDQGVVNRAQLDVKRRGAQICKLIVTTVEPGESVAEVVPGSLSPGQTIQEGDVVTKAEVVVAPPAPAESAPAATTPAPGDAPAPAPADAPFGPQDGGMTAPPADDPFGAPPADPAPAPADDPFGAPPADAAPAPADDPFAN